jgi:tRNA/rRNA methyltransferase
MLQIHFVLVQPAVPEHVGAAARALKTMGFRSLRIVDSDAHTKEPAKWLAHASGDVLGAAKAFATLAEALADTDFAVATTSRPRMSRRDHYTPPGLLQLLKAKAGAITQAAIVFGPEKRGLTNADVALCDVTSYVPMIARQPSLNLAQAVMVYAYVLSELTFGPATGAKPTTDRSQALALRRRASRLLERLDIPATDRFHVRTLERLSALATNDIRLAHSLCRRIAHCLPDASTHRATRPTRGRSGA